MVIDSFGEAVRQVVTNGLSPVLNASGTASNASTNPLDTSASTEEANTHAGAPDGDSISMRSPAHTTAPIGVPSRTCWYGEGIGSASATDTVQDTMDMATARPSIVIFCTMALTDGIN